MRVKTTVNFNGRRHLGHGVHDGTNFESHFPGRLESRQITQSLVDLGHRKGFILLCEAFKLLGLFFLDLEKLRFEQSAYRGELGVT